MTTPVQLFCWHFMAYPYLADDFDKTHDTGWVTVPNSLWDRRKSVGLYQEYIDQLAYGDQLGFDGMVLNEHHQNIYGLMPSPNLIAAALTQATKKGRIVVLGNLLPLHMNPLRVAEEYAMLDNMSNGRIVAGLAPGAGAENFNYDVPSAPTRRQFWEAVDLVVRAWTDDGPFMHEGQWYPMRYVNPWPKPMQVPHPPVWVPGSRSKGTMLEVAKRGFAFFLSSRSHGEETQRCQREFASLIESVGDTYQPFRMGILLSVYCGETDVQAKEEAREGVWYFLKNCLKGHLRRAGRQLTFGPGVPYMPPKDFRALLEHTRPDSKLLGDADSWEELEKSNSILVGSAETIYRRLSKLIQDAPVGNLLIQFHLGNMKQELVRKSMKRFIDEVAPRLREESKKAFAEKYGRALENPRTPGPTKVGAAR